MGRAGIEHRCKPTGHHWDQEPADAHLLRAFCEHGPKRVCTPANKRLALAGLLRVGGTGLEPVTPSLSIRRIERWRLAHTRESASLSGLLSVPHVLVGVGWSPKAR